MKVGIINYGVGNLVSVLRSFAQCGAAVVQLEHPRDLMKADRLVLPGVGNFSESMSLLHSGEWTNAIRDRVLGDRIPILGICLGMQLFATEGEEGQGSVSEGMTRGLDLIPAKVAHLRAEGCMLRTPHVGWNGVDLGDSKDALFKDIPTGTDFYFVHNYALVPTDETSVVGSVSYGIDFCAAVKFGNVWGTQFHPEKSSYAGLKLLSNFASPSLC